MGIVYRGIEVMTNFPVDYTITKVRREHAKTTHEIAVFSRVNNTCKVWHSMCLFQLIMLLMEFIHQTLCQINKVLSWP
jgi:hypothetical protein